jgi:hypothetical protein
MQIESIEKRDRPLVLVTKPKPARHRYTRDAVRRLSRWLHLPLANAPVNPARRWPDVKSYRVARAD